MSRPARPAVVAVGGGHGLAATLRAARRYAGEITAVVSVADDGGSSGRLRAAMPHLPAPGDVRRCLTALAAEHSALARTLEHRLDEPSGDLCGHALGNLLLAELATELGSFPAAVDEVARLVDATGRVLPATVGPVSLVGRRAPEEGTEADVDVRVHGQVAVQNTPGLVRLSLSPAIPESPPAVGEAIRAADQVLVGPGSLFTSVLAAAIVPAVHDALRDTRAQRVYVANLRPQVPETEGFALEDHLAVLADHGVPVDVVVCPVGQCEAGSSSVFPDAVLVEAPVADAHGLVHDAERLAATLVSLLRSP
ncbi:MAG: YvcK family protein [Actinobacteria bacterium]|nr:YvcK family protein [Actinomycetota bacterium]